MTAETKGTVIIQLVVTAVQAVTTVILLQLAVVTSLGILVVTAKYLQSVPVLLCMPLDTVTQVFLHVIQAQSAILHCAVII